MIKKFPFFAALATLLILLSGFFVEARAQTDAISTALRTVDKFDTEMILDVTPLSSDPVISNFISSSSTEIELTVKRLRALRWTEEPGPRRFQRLYSMVEGYISNRIGALMKLEGHVPQRERDMIDTSVKRLGRLKVLYLADLKRVAKYETRSRRSEKAVPLIDRDRYDDTPGQSKGIWER